MATGLSGISKQLRTIRQNALVWCVLFLAGLGVLLARFFQLQVLQHRQLLATAREYHERVVVLPAVRGRLLDRNLNVLALDDRRLSLYADPTLVQNPAFIAKQLAPVIDVPEATLLDTFLHPCKFLWLKRDVSAEIANVVKSAAYPGVFIKQDGWCYTVTVTPEKLPHSSGVTEQLAAALNLDPKTLTAQIGEIDADNPETPPGTPPAPAATTPPSPAPTAGHHRARHHAAQPATPPKPVTHQLTGLFPEGCKRAVEELHFHGVAFAKQRENYSVWANPCVYLDAAQPVAARPVAKQLGPLLGMTPQEVVARLRQRTRFVWLKRGMSEEMLNNVERLQGSMFVVDPGRVLADLPARMTEEKAMDKAVDQLDYVLNRLLPGRKGARVISRDALRAGLQPGAPSGALYQGKPSLKVTRYMYYKPIAGVMYGLPGVSVQQERRRYYPYNTLASATLGLVKYAPDGAHGVFGLEATQNTHLRGVDGSEAKEIDGRQMTIPERSKRTEPTNGHDVVLTLDLYIQQTAERELTAAVQAHHAKAGVCIVTDIATGEVLALANSPTWDANVPKASKVELINNAISNVYEPGSTFKLVAATGSLEEGLIHDGQIITTCRGSLQVGSSKPIKDVHGAHGPTDPGRMLEVSCNIAAATLAMRMGPERFKKWCKRLNFSTLTGIELAGEARGRLNAEELHKNATLARMGFGQSLNVTPLQMVSAYAAIANGGEWHQPHLIKGYVDDKGNVQEVPVEHHTVCTQKTATLLRGYLERVVASPHGTGGKAAIPGYRVAGKTGTAQKALGGGKRGYSGYVGSFVGFLPVEKPRLAIVVVIYEPTDVHYGGTIAAPVFSAVGRQAMEYLNISPSMPVKPTATPAAAPTPAHH